MTIYNCDCRDGLAMLLEADSVDSIVTDPPYELGFMGKSWDSTGIANDVQMWREALRVLKPGGHLLAFSGTRTYHRMVCAIEDAGFEIRDQIGWVYGSGFPKSHNLDGPWQGWGTALKPAWEPIVVARKPLIGTVAANVLAHGTGAINIDGCRVGTTGGCAASGGDVRTESQPGAIGAYGTSPAVPGLGRWPANLIHDGSEEVLACFPQSDGGGSVHKRNSPKTSGTYGKFEGGEDRFVGYADAGSAARFFYCAKASKTERNLGCEGLPLKASGMVSNTSGQHITRRDGGAPALLQTITPPSSPWLSCATCCAWSRSPAAWPLTHSRGAAARLWPQPWRAFSLWGLSCPPSTRRLHGRAWPPSKYDSDIMKANFKDTISAKRTGGYDGDGRALWRVVEPLLYWSALLRCWLVVPAGFVTNYASVPRLPIIYAWCGDRVYEPPAVHDLAYTLHAVLVATGSNFEVQPVTRKDADDLFLEALLAQPEAVDEATAHAMYAGVRLGGESSWRADTTVQQPEFINRIILPVAPRQVLDERGRQGP